MDNAAVAEEGRREKLGRIRVRPFALRSCVSDCLSVCVSGWLTLEEEHGAFAPEGTQENRATAAEESCPH